jgi:hypothetical protein
LINTAMFTYTGIGACVLIMTLAGFSYVNSIFHIAPVFVTTARWLLLMAGTAVALGFPLGVLVEFRKGCRGIVLYLCRRR